MIGFDSHCHLDFLADAAQCMAGAEANGPGRWLLPGTEPDQWQQAYQQFSEDDRVLLAAGHHPWFLPEGPPDTQLLEHWLDEHRHCVAVGEIGLDFFRHHSNSTAAGHQLDWFMTQLAVASERSLPVIIHSVKAHDRILQGLKRFPKVMGVVHGFVGPYAQARAYLDRGFYLGAGAVVFQSAKTLDAFARMPADRILVETDAPDQRVPEQCREKTGSSKVTMADNPLQDWLSILNRVAEAREMDFHALSDQIRKNAASLFEA